MSLQIWLPFNGHYKNQGLLGDVQINNVAPSFINDSEKGSVYSSGSLKISAEQAKILFSPNEFSFACWVKPISESNSGPILFGNSGMEPPNNREFTIFLYPTALDLHYSWQNESDTDAIASTLISNFFILNKWTHVAITYKNQTTNIYKNGVLYRTETSNITKRTQFFETILMSNWSNINLSDYRVYNHCLSPLEIKQLSVGLIGHYPLNQFEKSSKNLINNSKSLSYWIGYDEKTSNGMFSVAKFTYTNINEHYIDMRYSGTFNVESNTYYTFSFFAKASRNLTFKSYFYNNNNPDGYAIVSAKNFLGNTSTSNDGDINTNATTIWKRYWIIWKTGPHVTLPLELILARFVNTSNSKEDTIWIYAPKLEKGYNENPQWTPGFGDGDLPQIEYDISGKINNIPLSEDINPLFVSDTARYSGSYNFNEVGQTIGTREHIKPTKNVSISAWVKSSKIDTVTEPNVDVDGINIYVNNSGIIHLVGTFGDLNSGVSCIDTWTHVCGTYDGTTVKLYINGVLKSSKSYSSDLKYIKGAAISSDSKSGITCKVSDFRIFSTALKDDYITDLYNMGAAVSSGTLATYELNE